jgi:hypothetical protein
MEKVKIIEEFNVEKKFFHRINYKKMTFKNHKLLIKSVLIRPDTGFRAPEAVRH